MNNVTEIFTIFDANFIRSDFKWKASFKTVTLKNSGINSLKPVNWKKHQKNEAFLKFFVENHSLSKGYEEKFIEACESNVARMLKFSFILMKISE